MRFRCVLFSLLLLSTAAARADGDDAPSTVDVEPLRSLPALDNGRVKPFDTLARETVRLVTGRERFGPVDGRGAAQKPQEVVDATTLLLDWAAFPERWEYLPLLYVPLLELRAELEMDEAEKWAAPAVVRGDADFAKLVEDLKQRETQAEANNEVVTFTRLEQAALDLQQRLDFFHSAADLRLFAVLPEPAPSDDWTTLATITGPAGANTSAFAPIRESWGDLVYAYRRDDADAFAAAAAAFRQTIAETAGADYADHAAMGREVFYNQVKPFRVAWVAYLAALAALVASTMVRRPVVYRLAVGAFALAVLVNVAAFALRCSVTGWAPVTNMYETVVWVALMGAAFALVLELIYRRRVIAVGGAVVAVLGGVVADVMPPEYGRAVRNLAPVLRSNYWLTVHVLTIVSSYAAFALALVLGNVVLGQYLRQDRARARAGTSARNSASIDANTHFIYRAIQIGVLLVAAGTILGGLWADVSWGRFWGWDPKEVWALIVLLTYLALLHARFAGWVGRFGLAAGAVACFSAVVMSWYGVNFVLGTGKHTYGFGAGGQGYVATYLLVQWAFVAWAFVAHRRAKVPATSAAPSPSPAPSAEQESAGGPVALAGAPETMPAAATGK